MKVATRKNLETGDTEVVIAYANSELIQNPDVGKAMIFDATKLAVEKMAERFASDHYREIEAAINIEDISESVVKAIKERLSEAIAPKPVLLPSPGSIWPIRPGQRF